MQTEPQEQLAVTFTRDGAQLYKAVLDGRALDGIKTILSCLPSDKAGIRLRGIDDLDPYLSVNGSIGAIAQSILGPQARPVRAILFDKTASTNWSLGWHQDRTIAVQKRVELEGYGPWSTKCGLLHVAPPFELLAGMVTLRVHIDAVGPSNAPLKIALGSHRLGRIAEADIAGAVDKCVTMECLAEAGDVWLYATTIIHASDAAAYPSQRRVLQIDYSAQNLPPGLEWLGI